MEYTDQSTYIYNVYAQLLGRVLLSVTPGTVAHRDLLSMEFSRQGYWRGLSFPPPGDGSVGAFPSGIVVKGLPANK